MLRRNGFGLARMRWRTLLAVAQVCSSVVTASLLAQRDPTREILVRPGHSLAQGRRLKGSKTKRKAKAAAPKKQQAKEERGAGQRGPTPPSRRNP